MATIRIYQEDRLVIERSLPVGRLVVGRAKGCDLVLLDESVSRTHCLVEHTEDGRVTVVDRSRLGTRVNGERVEGRAEVRHGDRLGVGSCELEILLHDQDGAEADPTKVRTLYRRPEHRDLLEGLRLEVVEGPAAGATYRIPGTETSVGSRPSRIAVSDRDLYPDHFRLRVRGGRLVVEPGTGPVFVDGRPLSAPLPLGPDQEFRAGGSRFRLAAAPPGGVVEPDCFGGMLGVSGAMRRVFAELRRMAPQRATVLLLGESGTGKELAARGLHAAGPRAAGPFVAVNCASISPSLFESELFGHVEGAFTGALGRRDGAFQAAQGGTLFLDEVGEIPLEAQAKLLRVLESGEVRRVGTHVAENPDVRVVAATNRDLGEEVRRGRFREDLFHRLDVLTVHLPPLRTRPEDIPVLCRSFCASLKPPAVITERAIGVLRGMAWPGNVRALRNALVRAHVLYGSPITEAAFAEVPSLAAENDLRKNPVVEAERALCLEALRRCGGNQSRAALELGIPRTTLVYKLRRLGLK